jgi:ATP-dependent DNA helicase RecG
MEMMNKNPKISAKLISEEIGIAVRNVEANIRVLKQNGFIERVGSAKSGHWIINPTKL